MAKGIVFGIGVNDANYQVTTKEEGIKKTCPYYTCWNSMLRRCYSEVFQKREPSYIGCIVCDDWLNFSKFKTWMETQDWEGKQLDKDLLVPGNKVYSPETCVFVSQELNSFLTDRSNKRGKYLLGVDFHLRKKKFRARCSIEGNQVCLGYFDSEIEAHKCWLNKKKELSIKLASEQNDVKVSDALLKRYENVRAY